MADVWGLAVFRRAYALSLAVHRASQDWPRAEQFGGVADQVRRATKSVCALLVEGGGRQAASGAEFRRYLMMAIGSADEAKLWLRYAEDLGFIAAASAASWRQELSEIAGMLHGLRGQALDPRALDPRALEPRVSPPLSDN